MSAERQDEQQAAAATPCKYCKSLIPEQARYCTHCEKFQGRWDQLVSGASISALVSLISVGSLAYGFVAQQLKKAAPQVVLTPISCSTQDVRLSLSNLGDRPALFLGGTITMRATAGGEVTGRTLVGAAVPSLIAPQSSKIETLQIASMSPPHFPLPFSEDTGQRGGCQFDLKLQWTDGHGRKQLDSQHCSCGGG
jgi:hypothetical protein